MSQLNRFLLTPASHSNSTFKPSFDDYCELNPQLVYSLDRADSMEIHLFDLPNKFLIALEPEFRASLFRKLDSKTESTKLGISRSHYYHLKNGRHSFRLSTLKRFLSSVGVPLEEAEKHVSEIISNRGGRIHVNFPILPSSSVARLVGHCFGDGSISTKKGEFEDGKSGG